MPASVELSEGDRFTLQSDTKILVSPATTEMLRIGAALSSLLRASTGFDLPVRGGGEEAGPPAIELRAGEGAAELGAEGYELDSGPAGVVVRAPEPCGVFRGVQTLRQLFPPGIEADDGGRGPGPWTVPAGAVRDWPRFPWRGLMLDVARHFFTVREVKQMVDAAALYKLNVLHLHLTDDQGWRLEVRSWPCLAAGGGATQVGGAPGGYYSQEEYGEIVRYAAERYVTVVPEIDFPGHTHAALASCPELNPGGVAPAPYTGSRVGFSALHPELDETWRMVDDVVREVAALTPGAYLHVGGDEAETMPREAYVAFVERVQQVVARHGKRTIAWEEVANARLHPGTLVQVWKGTAPLAEAVAGGGKLVLSPASRVYLDMKYGPETELGIDWAGHVDVHDAYAWEPASFLEGVGEGDLAGIEAPVWTETLRNLTALQYMAFPRLPAIAEVGWTPPQAREWEGFRRRLAAHAPAWRLLGINFHRSSQVPWDD